MSRAFLEASISCNTDTDSYLMLIVKVATQAKQLHRLSPKPPIIEKDASVLKLTSASVFRIYSDVTMHVLPLSSKRTTVDHPPLGVNTN